MKFCNRQSRRLRGYDYSRPGHYFVTICSFQKEHTFSTIEVSLTGSRKKKNVILKVPGTIIKKKWERISAGFPHVESGDLIIMPNHIHGIIIINNIANNLSVGVGSLNPEKQDNVKLESGGIPPLLTLNTLSEIIAYFKYETTKAINILNRSPGVKLWQRNFYDHIIKDKIELHMYKRYIKANSSRWEEDEYFRNIV